MEQYISKAAIIAEIERIKKEECPVDSYEGRCKLLWFEQFLSFLNTLEVKEVEVPVSNDLEEAAHLYVDTTIECFDSEGNPCCYPAFIAGAQWQKEHLWKDAQGDDLPDTERYSEPNKSLYNDLKKLREEQL